MVMSGNKFPNRSSYLSTDASILSNGYFILLWGLYLNTKNPTHPPPTICDAVVAGCYKHCSTAANPIFQKQDSNSQRQHPTPHKNFKKFQGTMSNVGHGIIKKDPRTSADVPGAQGGFPQGEAMNKKNLHHCRKEVYTNCNEAASATPAQFLRNARTSN